MLENTVDEGNGAASLEISYSDDFPESRWTLLFSADDSGDSYDQIVSVDAEKVYLRHGANIHVYDWQGRQDTDASVVLTHAGAALRLDADRFLARNSLKLASDGWMSADILEGSLTADVQSFALTKDGRLLVSQNDSGTRSIRHIPIEDVYVGILKDDDLSEKTYEDIRLSDDDLDDLPNNAWYLASDVNSLYIEPRTTGDHYIRIYNTEYNGVVDKRIPMASSFIDYAPLSLFVFEDRLFRYNTNNALEFLDLTEWQIPTPLEKIYPQAVSPGDRIDLKKFMKSAAEITFDAGFKIPDWLSLEDDRWLVIADDAPTDATAYLRLRGINRVGASPLHGCMFYVYVDDATCRTPVWFNVDTLTMRDGQAINFFEYVRGADTIEAVHGNPLPDFLDLEDGILRVVGEGATANVMLRAGTHDGFFSDIAIDLRIIEKFENASILNVIDAVVEIQGIDVTEYLVRENFPALSKDLDWVRLGEFKRGRLSVSLYSNAENNGFFNDTNPNSFWATNDLNKNGYLNTISVSVILERDAESERELIFEGVIFDADDSITDGQLTLTCYDTSYILKNSVLQETIRGVQKTLELSPQQRVPRSRGDLQHRKHCWRDDTATRRSME